ncbi:probable LRR receptor-like serine/threonine-protein kinase At1g67720 [Magnolia sinica]|uniref:probable LRR receptor-like serine/threonine-protein kinase At1g67720 n=1 Tax=Magnolia sinica TaxID=86752 RepID=UPI00265A7B48|nr:probable LRR receptor-like serine/threonine-protein kinase At1g67720 [Magnolia sinica]
MSLSIFLLWLFSIPIYVNALPAPRGFFINCGASKETNDGSIKWLTEDGFITVGNKTTLETPNLVPHISTLRFFPDEKSRKYCYVIPAIKGGKYLIRTTYYYGGFDGGNEPPVFDQIIEGSKWSTVNTSESFSKGLTSYYEIVVAAMGKTLSICLARNEHTKSSPFISALELEFLEDSMYNSTDFSKYALGTIARHRFGDVSEIMGFPDDPFNRYWEPFKDNNPQVACHSTVTPSDFWNIPPAKAFEKALTTSRGKTLELQWPPTPLPTATYYIAFYFQDNRTPSPYSWRVFSITINGKIFYKSLNVSTAGITVFGSNWPLSGQTQLTLTPDDDSPVGPVINAAELLQLVPIGGRTITRDVIAMEAVARSLNNPPADWTGDPCLPRQNSWTGVACSQDKFARVISLKLDSLGLSGSLSPSIANLTSVSSISLGDNKLSGSIPDLSHMKQLKYLHLENNQLSGKIPNSLGHLDNLQELFLQNNNFEGGVPESLKSKSGLKIQV